MGNVHSNWKKDVWLYWMPEARKAWPIDTESHVYLCRALDPVGKALFGEKWTGTEPCEFADISAKHPISRNVFIHIEQSQATEFQREQIFLLLREKLGTQASLPSNPKQAFDAGLWRLGCQLAENEDGRRQQARDRARAVIEAIRDAILRKTMGFGFREIPGGSITKHDASQPFFMADSYWNGENLTPRIAYGQINLVSPFGDSPKYLDDGKRDFRNHSWHYIYLDRRGLARLLRETNVSPPTVFGTQQEKIQEPIEAAPLAQTLESVPDNQSIFVDSERLTPATTIETETSSAPKRAAVLAAAKALFPAGLPPIHVMPKQIVRNRIAEWMQKNTHHGEVTDRTITDALKLYRGESRD